MSSADLYEDGFPHGTKEGYDRGCRGSACPGMLEEAGQTCATAKARYNGDYGYRKRVDAGMTPAQIRAEEPARPAETKAKPQLAIVEPKPEPLHLVDAKPVARPKLPEPTPVAAVYEWSADQGPATEAERETAEIAAGNKITTVDPTTGKTIPLDQHGTHKGYWNGCRDINCPGVKLVGRSCRAALNEYQAAKRKERLERAAQQTAPTAVEEEPAIEATPELSADELVKIEAFGLHQAEQGSAPMAEWERELLRIADADPEPAASDESELTKLTRESDSMAREYVQLISDHAELEERYRRLLAEFEQVSKQPEQLATSGARTIKITLVGDACEITVGSAS